MSLSPGRGIGPEPAEALANGYWSAAPALTLCGDLAEKGIALTAVQGGVCPAHGGDACLFQYVELRAARAMVASLFAPAAGVPDKEDAT